MYIEAEVDLLAPSITAGWSPPFWMSSNSHNESTVHNTHSK